MIEQRYAQELEPENNDMQNWDQIENLKTNGGVQPRDLNTSKRVQLQLKESQDVGKKIQKKKNLKKDKNKNGLNRITIANSK